MENATQLLLAQLNAAVSVIVLSPEIRKYLTVIDPKALDQCFDAYNAYRNRFSEWRPSEVSHEDFLTLD
jgi:hypothetical protein